MHAYRQGARTLQGAYIQGAYKRPPPQSTGLTSASTRCCSASKARCCSASKVPSSSTQTSMPRINPMSATAIMAQNICDTPRALQPSASCSGVTPMRSSTWGRLRHEACIAPQQVADAGPLAPKPELCALAAPVPSKSAPSTRTSRWTRGSPVYPTGGPLTARLHSPREGPRNSVTAHSLIHRGIELSFQLRNIWAYYSSYPRHTESQCSTG